MMLLLLMMMMMMMMIRFHQCLLAAHPCSNDQSLVV